MADKEWTPILNENWEIKKITRKQLYAIGIILREVKGVVFEGFTRGDASDFISKYIEQYEGYKAKNHKAKCSKARRRRR